MVYHTGDSSPASSDPVSGIISARNMIKTTHFLLLQQQKKSFRPQTTINLYDSIDKNVDSYISLCVKQYYQRKIVQIVKVLTEWRSKDVNRC